MRVAGLETTAQAVVFFYGSNTRRCVQLVFACVDVGWAVFPAHAFDAPSLITEHAWFERVGGAAAHPTSADQAAVFFLVDRECGWRYRDGRCRNQVRLPHWRRRHRGRCGVTGGAVRCRGSGRSRCYLPGTPRATRGVAGATWSAGAVGANRHAGQSRRVRASPDGRRRRVQTMQRAAGTGRDAARGGRRCSSATMPSAWEKAPRVLVQRADARNALHAGKASRSRDRDHRSRSVLFSGGIAP